MENERRNKEINKVVKEVGEKTKDKDFRMVYTGFYHYICGKRGHANLLAIDILCEILYWYKPKTNTFDIPKFEEDLYYLTYDDYAECFNVSKDMVRDAFEVLEEYNLIKRSYRVHEVNRVTQNGVVFVQIFPDNIFKILEDYKNKKSKKVSEKTPRRSKKKLQDGLGKKDKSININNNLSRETSMCTSNQSSNEFDCSDGKHSRRNIDGLMDKQSKIVEDIKNRINYNRLIKKLEDKAHIVNELVNEMLRILISDKSGYMISNIYVKSDEMKNKVNEIDYNLAEYLVNNVSNRKITNISAYLRASIYKLKNDYMQNQSVKYNTNSLNKKCGFNDFQQTNTDDELDEMEKLFLQEVNSPKI